MKKQMALMVVLLAAVAIFAVGCGDKKADTPKQAMENMQEALLEGDSDAFVACFDATEDEKKVLASMCDFLSTMHKFQEAMKKAYGEDAVNEKGDDLADKKWLEEITVKIDGDKATVMKKGESKPMNLVKKDGAWKIVPDDMLPQEDVDKALKMFEVMAKAHKDQMGNIGKDGYTAEKINEELGNAMMKAMMGNMPKQ